MSKLWTIIVREYREVVHKKSFVVGILLTPVMIGAWLFIPTLLMQKSETPTQDYALIDLDDRGLGEEIATALNEIKTSDGESQFSLRPLETYESQEHDSWLERRMEIDAEVQNGDLDGALILYPNVVETDSLIVISKSFDFKVLRRAERAITTVFSRVRLSTADIGLDIDSVQSLTRRTDIKVVSPAGKSKDFIGIFFGMMIFAMIIFMMVINYGQALMRSVIEEKNSRIMEVIVSSVTPFQLMLGKVLGLGAAALTQILAWFALGLAARLSMGSAGFPEEVTQSISVLFNPIFVTFFVLYLGLGFLFYSAIFAGIGAIVTSDKEAQNFLGPIIIVFVTPFMLASVLPSAGDKTWVLVLSMIPLLTPSLMVMRLSLADPQVFTLADPIILQATLGVLVLAGSTMGLTWVVSRIFRIGILMYGKRATLPEVMRWVRQT
ncbi:MAG: ABC transporter permease [Candidatus Zixiibacteriota bacterium]